MSERDRGAVTVELDRERGKEPSLATATNEGAPARSAPAREGQERMG
jgi:hypothetical protein